VRSRRAQQQQVGAGAPGDVAFEPGLPEQRRALGHRLEQVPIDGEAVVGVALGQRPDVRPFGQQPLEHTHVVERLERRDRPAA
jgi:hypothetical protein